MTIRYIGGWGGKGGVGRGYMSFADITDTKAEPK